MLERPLLNNWHTVLTYIRADLAHLSIERFRVLYLDTKFRLIADDLCSTGTIDAAPFYCREVVARALEVGAASLILAHNHPSGDPSPSPTDVAQTRRLVEAAKIFNIAVLDHYIIGRSQHLSFVSHGLL